MSAQKRFYITWKGIKLHVLQFASSGNKSLEHFLRRKDIIECFQFHSTKYPAPEGSVGLVLE